ncbi:MAG: YHS domain-containing (seleno)protein [Planctomycetota bacterium]
MNTFTSASRFLFATFASLTLMAFATPAMAQAITNPPVLQADNGDRNTDEWNLPKRGDKLAVDGYDPVAYFPEGGEKATKGKKSIAYDHAGVTYRFSSQKHKDLFVENPDRYEPAHGGWCSWAMREGGKTEPNPKNFIVKDDRLFLFYKGFLGDTKKDWEKTDHDESAQKADNSWKDISGEEKRQAPEKE